jgi:hypothetical protein
VVARKVEAKKVMMIKSFITPSSSQLGPPCVL